MIRLIFEVKSPWNRASWLGFGFDSDAFVFRPRGEMGVATWGRFAAVRWLGLYVVAQKWHSEAYFASTQPPVVR